MYLNGVHQVSTTKNNNQKLNSRRENRVQERELNKSALLQLGATDLRDAGVYHPQSAKDHKKVDKKPVQNTKAETLRSIVEKMTFKQALADPDVDGEYWNAASTSQRVIELAKALAIDDPERVHQMKKGFIKGFHDARELYGKDLPQVCIDTFNKTTEAFDSWISKEQKRDLE
jgi:hypothetical protein